jgi:hypothetical protein
MRVEQKTVTYYTLAELKEIGGSGYDRALDTLRASLWEGGHWLENIADTIAYTFGKRVGDTTVERYGEGDYPGVAGVELKNWAVQDRSAHVGFAGTIYPDAAPGLPWHEWIDSVTLTAHRHGTGIDVNDSDDAPYIGWSAKVLDEDQQRLMELRQGIIDVIREALEEALAAGEQTAEAEEADENLLELADANEWEFDSNGAWA